MRPPVVLLELYSLSLHSTLTRTSGRSELGLFLVYMLFVLLFDYLFLVDFLTWFYPPLNLYFLARRVFVFISLVVPGSSHVVWIQECPVVLLTVHVIV